jgi:RNA-directed DNA polymerase
MKDRAMQALYLLARDPIAATLAEPNSSGFRLERSTADAIDQGHRVVSRRWSARWLLEGDSRAGFDRFSHDWLVANIPREKAILRKGLQAGCMDKPRLSPTAAGVPQGGVMSPVIRNLALTGLERHVKGAFPASQGTPRTTGHGSRCAEDFLITGRSTGFLEQEAHPLVEQCLAERGLERSREQTRVTHSEAGFDFRGTRGRQYRGKRLCPPAKKNGRTCLDTLRGLVKRHQHAITGNGSMQLHPVMRGWAQYHQPGASTRTVAQVDQQIFPLLWQWARRRHPRTSRHWIRDKDFRSEGGNNWACFGHVMRSQGTPQAVRRFRAASVPIRRHTTIKGEAHPYDPQWAPYFDARLGVRRAHNLQGRRSLLRLWKEQDGLCVVCPQRITQRTGWQSQHLVWRTPGGADRAENRVLLHPNCHTQVHRQGLTVVKPRPQQGVGTA